MIIHCEHIVLEREIIDGYLTVEDGKITDIVKKSVEEKPCDIDFGSNTIIAGIFDTHNHGYMGFNPSNTEALGKDEVIGYVKALASAGVTEIFPTVTLKKYDNGRSNYGDIVEAYETQSEGARIMGIHSEGPYLNRVGEKGVDRGHPDIDINFLQEMIHESKGILKLVAIAPELPGSKEAIRFLVKNNSRVAYAHSNDNYEEAMEAFENGISVVTHTANVMSGIHHRNMGGLGAALLNDTVYNEMICDGLHVRNEMMEIMLRVKKDYANMFMMISDNVQMAGFPVGKYHGPFGETYITEEGFSLTDTGRLAGSTKPVLYGMRNLVKNMGYSLVTVSRMASLNPNRVYGFADRKGSLTIGKDADFVVIDDDFKCLYTYREGKKIYDHKIDTSLIDEAHFNYYKVNE